MFAATLFAVIVGYSSASLAEGVGALFGSATAVAARISTLRDVQARAVDAAAAALPIYLERSGSRSIYAYSERRRAVDGADPTSWLNKADTRLKCAAMHALRADQLAPKPMWDTLSAAAGTPLNHVDEYGGQVRVGHLWAGARVDIILAALYRIVDIAAGIKVDGGAARLRRSYLDVAAAFPQTISSTMMLDACYGWAGVCVEADTMKHADLHAKRSCIVAETCVHERDGEEVEFVVDQYTAASDQKGRSQTRGLSGLRGMSAVLEGNQLVSKMTCLTLSTIARDAGMVQSSAALSSSVPPKRTPLHADVMSLDIEGAEHLALRGINWNAFSVGMIVMEINDAHRVDAATGVVPEAGQQSATALTKGGYVPVFAVFSYRGGIPMADCLGIALGYTPLDIFADPRWTSALARWRTSDVFFMRKGSEEYAAALAYIKSAGCSTAPKAPEGTFV